MENFFSILIKSIFVDNMIFAYFLGMCSFLAVSKDVKTSMKMGIAVVFVCVVTLPINYLLEIYVLREGALSWLSPDFATLDLSFLALIFFIAVMAAVVQVVEMVIEKTSPALYNSLGIFLPLIAVNCAIIGISLFMQQRVGSTLHNMGDVFAYGLGSGIGWLLAIVGLAAIREKMEYSDVPKPLRGLGITFITTALMGLAFMCFMGLDI
jgi:Na+-transporting NADH:ubiquinone oxidoreductase subunit E